LDEQEKKLLERCQALRNDFAHGDWQNVRSSIGSLPFADAIGLVSSIFTKMEHGLPSVD
jgi:hypothetical protein